MSRPTRYPEIEVQLSGEDGNAFFIISRVRVALRRAGVEDKQLKLFTDEAMFSDYENVLQTCMEWVTCL